MISGLDNLTDPKEKEDYCKGRVYTYLENNYISSRGEVVCKVTFRPLKRLSCSGCERCGGFDDAIRDEIGEGLMIPYPANLNHGNSVELVFINDGRGFEDYYDEFHLEFRRLA